MLGGAESLVRVCLDGVAGGHGEIGRQLIEIEPANLARFGWLAVSGFAGEDLAQVGWRDPVLVFAREAVIGDAKQGAKRDFHADFFASFADGALLKSFEKVHFAADDAPAAGFGRPFAEREEHAAVIVGEENADADSGLKRFGHRDLTGWWPAPVREESGRRARPGQRHRRTRRSRRHRQRACSKRAKDPRDSRRPNRQSFSDRSSGATRRRNW